MSKLSVLFASPSPGLVEKVLAGFREDWPDPHYHTVVDSLEAFRDLLPTRIWHFVVVDTATPSFDGQEPVEFVEGLGLNGPILYVSEGPAEGELLKTMEKTLRYHLKTCDLDMVHTVAERARRDARIHFTERRVRDQYEALTFNLPGAAYRRLADDDWTMYAVSDAIESICGHTADALERNRHLAYAGLIHPSDRTEAHASIMRSVTRKEPFSVEYRLIDADGRTRWLTDRGQGIFDGLGRLIFICGFLYDDTERRRSQRALRESEERFRAILESADDCIAVFDAGYNVLYANDAWVDYVKSRMGLEPYRNLSALAEAHPAIGREWMSRIDRVISEGKPLRADRIMIYKGQKVFTEASLSPMFDAEGKPFAVTVIYRDVTERRLTEEALRDSEQLYSATIDALDYALHVVDKNLRILFTNRHFAEWTAGLGLAPDPSGQILTDVYPFLGEKIIREYEMVFEMAMPMVTEENTRIGEGNIITRTQKVPIVEEGKVTRVITLIKDITDEKLAEQALREGEARYATTVDALDEAVHVIDRDFRILMANRVIREWGRRIGIADVDPVGYRLDEAFSFLESRIFDDYRRIFETGQRQNERLAGTFGNWTGTVDVRRVPLKDGEQVTHVVTIITDVTEEENARQALRGSEERYRSLFEYSPIALWEVDLSEVKRATEEIRQSGVEDLAAYFRDYPEEVLRCLSLFKVLDINAQALKLHQARDRQEFFERFEDMFTEAALEAFAAQLVAVGEGATTHDVQASGVTLRGERRHLAIRWAVLPGHEETYERALVSMVDITRLRKADEDLRDSESRYRTLFEEAPIALWEFDNSLIKDCLDDLRAAGVRDIAAYLDLHPETVAHCQTLTRVTDVNHAAVRMHGARSKEELLESYLRFFDRGNVATFKRRLAAIAEGLITGEAEASTRRIDGSRIPIYVRTAVVPGHEARYDKVLVSVVDLSRIRDAEEDAQRIQAQLFQSQKTEAIGQLAGGLAHDFNNLLTIIATAVDAVVDVPGLAPESREEIKEIRRAAGRAASLTQQLLAFSRKQVLRPVRLRLNDLLSNLEWMVQRLTGPRVTLDVLRGDTEGFIEVDPNRMEQAILNVVVNAVDAMPDGGRLTLRTMPVPIDEKLSPAAYVAIEISDTGVGMDKKTLARALDPFFTTKEVGKGTGLGLPTAYGIVRQSGGDLTIVSRPNQGTTVRIVLPVVDGGAEERPLSEAVEPSAAVGGSVLVVEDEPALRRRIVKILDRHGFEVLQAVDSVRALDVLADPSVDIDLLLTDLVMPGITGEELGRRALADRPHLRVLYVSGYAGDIAFRNRSLGHHESFLQKPFTADALVNSVRRSLSDIKDAEN